MARPKNQELPGMVGPGVEKFTDKKLDKLGDEFVDLRDQKAKLAEEMTAVEAKILDRMTECDIINYRFSDQLMFVKPGKNHVKIKTVKVGDDDEAESEPSEE